MNVPAPPTITLVRDTDSTVTPHLEQLNDPAGQTCAVMVRPSPRVPGVLAADILRQRNRFMAPLRGASGKNDSFATAIAWLTVEPIDHLLVGYAETLTPTMLTALTHLCQLCDINLWLVLDAHFTDRFHTYRDAFGADLIDGPDWQQQWDSRPQRALRPPTPTDRSLVDPRPADIDHVPDDVITFLTTSERTLSPDAYQRVRAEFLRAHTATVELIGQHELDENLLAEHLRELAAGTTTIAHVTTLVRGMQAAALVNGYHLRVDVRRYLNRATNTTTMLDLRPADWDRVAATCTVRTGAVAVLASLGLDVTTIAELPADATNDSCTTVTAHGRHHEVPEAAQPVLRAYDIYRRLTAPNEHRLIVTQGHHTLVARGVSMLLDGVAANTGLAFRAKHEQWNADAERWRLRWGIGIERLAA